MWIGSDHETCIEGLVLGKMLVGLMIRHCFLLRRNTVFLKTNQKALLCFTIVHDVKKKKKKESPDETKTFRIHLFISEASEG